MDNKDLSVSRLKEWTSYLETHPAVVCNPYPEYDSRIYELLRSLGTDDDYLSHYEEIESKDIGEMSVGEIQTMFTFIERGERFCDGHIAGYVEDGTLLRLANRLLEQLTDKASSDR